MANANPHFDFLAFVKDEKDVATLKSFAEGRGWDEKCIHDGGIAAAVEYLKESSSPSYLLVEISDAKAAAGELDGLAEVCDPDTKVIVIGDVNEYSFYCWLRDLGISSYLLKPMTQEALDGALQKAENPAGVADGDKKPGMMIAVLGSRGGVGATSLCINLAGVIAELSKKNTALVDLDAREGSVALALDLEPSRGLREALEKPERIDTLFIERVMTKINKNLSILSAEENIQESFKIDPNASTALVNQLKESYEVIIVDVPRHLDSFSTQCLGAADHVVLATELNLLSLRDTLRFQDLMRETLKLKPPIVVAQRVGLAPKQQVLQADFEKGINTKVSYNIPFAPDIFMPIDLSIPALKSKSNAAVKPIYELAEQLVPEAKAGEQKESKKAAKKGGFFSKK